MLLIIASKVYNNLHLFIYLFIFIYYYYFYMPHNGGPSPGRWMNDWYSKMRLWWKCQENVLNLYFVLSSSKVQKRNGLRDRNYEIISIKLVELVEKAMKTCRFVCSHNFRMANLKGNKTNWTVYHQSLPWLLLVALLEGSLIWDWLDTSILFRHSMKYHDAQVLKLSLSEGKLLIPFSCSTLTL